MRTFVSALAVILTLLLTAFAVPAAWTERNIVREDGFVQLAGQLGKDPVFQASLAGIAVSNLEASLDLPAPAEELGASLLQDAAQRMSTWPEYPQAWNETIRRSHRLNFAEDAAGPRPAPSSEGSGAGNASGGTGAAIAESSLVLDLGPFVRLLGDKLGAATGIQLDVPDTAVVGVGGLAQRQMVDRIAAYAPLWLPAAIGAAMSLALALLAARRRSLVLLWTGLGLFGLAGLVKAGATLFGGFVGTRLSDSTMASLFVHDLTDVSVASLAAWTDPLAFLGAVMFLAGVPGLILWQRRRARRAPRRPGAASAPGSMEG
ncbi:hypothetical protein BIU82_02640 [Arthrobacter sp. SW1]|uniref:hypothetical protein n=1 Tax=Arthrobacter sp. SW1 TaxID=1920889 RepID=UPI000877B676|nr:hypothetical protein [Arthrobacter sp. SW1]OFI39954.1 hypothetical protein BIU82_02640 [Arthrobacter sp. SW1]